jgi:hypothetical protein
MLSRELTPGERAHVDQVLALVADVERAWPMNEHLMNDPEVERVVLERLSGWQGLAADRAFLLWGNGRMVEVKPDWDDITRMTRGTMPRLDESECDRCRVVGAAGVAVIAVPRNLIPLLLCGTCFEELQAALITEEE